MLIWNFTIYATLRTAENPVSVRVLELVVLANFSVVCDATCHHVNLEM
jgi:hypothetical protein